MLRLLRIATLAVLLSAAGIIALVLWPIGTPPAAIELDGNVERGAYLARASGCISCHTDMAGGGPPLAGGAPLHTEFGTFHPPNLTTDPEHGIGNWTVEDFAMAVRQGISPGGRPYFPTFTYPFYGTFTDQQIADLWAAFQTVPPVAESSPAHDVPFPFDQRWGLKLWRAAYLRPPRTAPDPQRSDAWNRGKELVRGAAHCGACHTPRNAAGARMIGAAFAGTEDLPGSGKAPSIRADNLRAGDWTVDSLAFALRTGAMPDGDVFGGSMAEVVSGGTAYLSPQDLEAIARYVLDED